MAPNRLYHNHTHYSSYLLRIWQAGSKGAPAWRIVLISPHSGKRWSFKSLPELAKFLEQEMGAEEEDKGQGKSE